MNTIRKPFVIALLAVLVLGLAGMAFAATPVFAQTDTPPAPSSPVSPASPARAIARLERLFQVEKNTLERQAAVLDKAAKLVTRAEEIIANFQAKGVDTTKLEAALKNFEGQLADAVASHARAAEIINTHPGFDALGKVTNRIQAAQTVKDAGQALKHTRRTIVDGRQDLNQFLRDWRKDHKPTPTTAP